MKTFLAFFSLFSFLFVLSGCDLNNTHLVEISYESNGGTAYPSISIISNSHQFSPPIPQKENYIFANWYIDEALTAVYTYQSLLLNKTLTLYAKYLSLEQDDYVVVYFQSVGGTFIPNQILEKGTVATRPEDPRVENFTFDDWYVYNLEQGTYDLFNFESQIHEHTTLVALYNENN